MRANPLEGYVRVVSVTSTPYVINADDAGKLFSASGLDVEFTLPEITLGVIGMKVSFACGGAHNVTVTAFAGQVIGRANMFPALAGVSVQLMDAVAVAGVRIDLVAIPGMWLIVDGEGVWQDPAVPDTRYPLGGNLTDGKFERGVMTDPNGQLQEASESALTRSIQVTFGDGADAGSVVDGAVVYLPCPLAGTLTAWTMVADDATTEATIDVWKANAALPDSGDTIVNGNDPELSADMYATDVDITDWSDTTVDVDDVFGFELTLTAGAPLSISLQLTLLLGA